MDWILPPASSSFASSIDGLYYLILIITGIAFVVTEAALIIFLIKYRARPGRRASYIHGSTKAEVIWTAVPAVTVVAIGLLSGPVWNRVKGRDSIPAGSMPVAVHVQQFEWQITYPGLDGEMGSADDFTIRNQLHLLVDTPTVVHLTAEDVIHSFFIPAFRVKQDAIPGMPQLVWFKPQEAGDFELACAELCGLGHYRMRASVVVHEADEYQAWLLEQSQPVALK